uniref:Uncharacterized protein n=1 Tax=Brassica oleracea var. oleracea TaxID=109376 RepID=A0A0D3DDU5_BRAOL
MAEALAVFSALKSAVLLDVSSIKIHFDNQTLIKVIKNKLFDKEIYGVLSEDSELRFTSLSQESQTDRWFCLSGESVELSEEHPVAPVAEHGSCDLSSRSVSVFISKGIRQNHACEADFLRVIKMLNYTIRVVLEYMNDAKDVDETVYVSLEEAVRDDEIVFNGLPSSEPF